ncbi:hypothetical protein B0H13DRAFT_2342057 [Mycena leptocephala]|nr:hypothetical protein B0H13DRAFT_2342057 [Mycena leptocephala]
MDPPWTQEEQDLFCCHYAANGEQFNKIAVFLTSKTSGQVENYFRNYFLPSFRSNPRPIINTAGEEEWLIEAIVEEFRSEGLEMQYRVRFLGFGPDEDLWYHQYELADNEVERALKPT